MRVLQGTLERSITAIVRRLIVSEQIPDAV
jgi:hypothetical protein